MFSSRLDYANMKPIQKYTTLWRMTCSFQTSGIDYRDYVRGKKQELDVITFDGDLICKKVEYVNIRGHMCLQCTVSFYQRDNCNLHLNSDITACDFHGSHGAVYSEDNFGCYMGVHSAFRCARNPESTSQVWFGDYIYREHEFALPLWDKVYFCFYKLPIMFLLAEF